MYNVSDFECSNESSTNSSCHFWNRKVRIYSDFASLFSVMKDNSCIFLAQTSYTLDKNNPSKWKFWTFERLGEISPNSSCHFWNKESVFFSNFASLFIVMKHNSSVFFHLNLYMPWTKASNQSENLTACMKINQTPYVIFQATSQFSFKFCITLQCHDT